MSRVAFHSHQAGDDLSLSDVADDEIQIGQPFDPFEEVPHGVSHEEIGFGSLAFEDSVIVERARKGAPAGETRLGAAPFGRLSVRRAARR